MDMRSFETRYLTDMGLLNIRNKCFKALVDAQDYSMSGKINIHNVQWYITPILNGMIRIGSPEEKELLFRAFIEQDEFFEYKKRATKDKPAETIQESIYDRAARLCKNAKSRQDKQKEKISLFFGRVFSACYQILLSHLSIIFFRRRYR
jgi:single-stranded-DNA-specific exonuclease